MDEGWKKLSEKEKPLWGKPGLKGMGGAKNE